jgi:hypothetical protein
MRLLCAFAPYSSAIGVPRSSALADRAGRNPVRQAQGRLWAASGEPGGPCCVYGGVILRIARNRGSMSAPISQVEESAATSLELRRPYFHHLTNK